MNIHTYHHLLFPSLVFHQSSDVPNALSLHIHTYEYIIVVIDPFRITLAFR
uniref:Peptide encoded by miPEP319a n=1 Tax=Arabidopsis thaliana TaxID=3702 RepID=P319A_ARATH|nr:RecName: Full=Peptide encoded by miPEP319a [Arabidopsis thaliana]